MNTRHRSLGNAGIQREGTIIAAPQIRTQHILWAGYALAAALVLTPLLDLLTRTWPLRPGEVGWRFGAAGIAFNTLVTPLLGLFVAIVTAAILNHKLVVRILSILSYVIAVLLALGMGLFVLDFLQVRSEVAMENRANFSAPTSKAIILGAVGVVLAVWYGLGAQRAVRRRRA